MKIDAKIITPVFDFFKKRKFLLLVLSIVVILRIPSLFEPNRYADEDIYLTIGQGIRKGLILYRDIHDNKPPLIYITAALGQSVFGFRLILLLSNLVNIVFFWLLAENIFKKKAAVYASAFIFAILSTIPLLEGNISNGEIFFILPATAAMFLLFREVQKKTERLWVFGLSGFLFSLAFLYKVPILFDFAAACLFVAFFAKNRTFLESLRYLFTWRFLFLIFAFFAPIFLSILIFGFLGAYDPYVKGALLQNIAYLSSWGGQKSGGILSSGLVQRALIVFAFTVFVYILKKRLSLAVIFASLWFVFALFGVLLSFRPYPHYLLEALPPALLLLVLFFKDMKVFERLTILALAGLAVFFYIKVDFWYYRSLPYYQNFLKFALRLESREEYFNFFGKVNRNYQISEYVIEHTNKNDRIFVWGTEPAIYAISDRLPLGKYTVEYHIVDFNAYGETIAAFSTNPPKIVVTFPNEAREFPRLHEILGKRYFLAKEIDNADVWLLIPQPTSSFVTWQAVY